MSVPNPLPPFELTKPGDVQAVIRYETQKRWPEEFREWHTTWEGVSKVMSEGASLYHLALAVRSLVENWEGDRDIRYLMAFPVLNAGLSRTSHVRYTAEWQYKRQFVDPAALQRYDFWLDRLDDARRIHDSVESARAVSRLQEMLRSAKPRRNRA